MSKSHPSHGPRVVNWRDSRLERLVASALDGAEILKVTALKSDAVEAGVTAKDTGYGAPLRIDVRHNGELKSVVLHSATPNPFGHEFRANRAEEMLIAADTFGLVPRHTRGRALAHAVDDLGVDRLLDLSRPVGALENRCIDLVRFGMDGVVGGGLAQEPRPGSTR